MHHVTFISKLYIPDFLIHPIATYKIASAFTGQVVKQSVHEEMLFLIYECKHNIRRLQPGQK